MRDLIDSLTLTIGDGFVGVSIARFGTEERVPVTYDVVTPDGVCTGTDLHVFRQGSDEDTLLSALAALLSFLGAAGDAYSSEMRGQESENSDLFPPVVMEWAYVNVDEIACADLATDGEDNFS